VTQRLSHHRSGYNFFCFSDTIHGHHECPILEQFFGITFNIRRHKSKIPPFWTSSSSLHTHTMTTAIHCTRSRWSQRNHKVNFATKPEHYSEHSTLPHLETVPYLYYFLIYFFGTYNNWSCTPYSGTYNIVIVYSNGTYKCIGSYSILRQDTKRSVSFRHFRFFHNQHKVILSQDGITLF